MGSEVPLATIIYYRRASSKLSRWLAFFFVFTVFTLLPEMGVSLPKEDLLKKNIETYRSQYGDKPFKEILPPLVPSLLFLHGQVASIQPSIFYGDFVSSPRKMTLMMMMDWMTTVMMMMDQMTKMITGCMMKTMSCH